MRHSTFLVRDDDSGRVEEAHNIVPAGGWSFGAGDEVMVDDYGAWMRARVTQAHRDGSFSVQYEDGRRGWGEYEYISRSYIPFSHRDASEVSYREKIDRVGALSLRPRRRASLRRQKTAMRFDDEAPQLVAILTY